MSLYLLLFDHYEEQEIDELPENEDLVVNEDWPNAGQGEIQISTLFDFETETGAYQ